MNYTDLYSLWKDSHNWNGENKERIFNKEVRNIYDPDFSARGVKRIHDIEWRAFTKEDNIKAYFEKIPTSIQQEIIKSVIDRLPPRNDYISISEIEKKYEKPIEDICSDYAESLAMSYTTRECKKTGIPLTENNKKRAPLTKEAQEIYNQQHEYFSKELLGFINYILLNK